MIPSKFSSGYIVKLLQTVEEEEVPPQIFVQKICCCGCHAIKSTCTYTLLNEKWWKEAVKLNKPEPVNTFDIVNGKERTVWLPCISI